MPPIHSNELTDTSVKILLVDDESTIRNSISEILQLKGFDVTQAENGYKALEIFEKQGERIDLILLDMTMPILSGFETLIKLRRLDRSLPIIIFSGYGEQQVDSQSLDLFNTRFLKKPFKVDALLQTIRESLENRPKTNGRS